MLKDPYNRPITSLRISLTNRCNQNCIYCHNEGDKEKESDIPGEIVRKVAEVGRGQGIRRVKLTGGEPLLRNDLEEVLKYLPRFKDVSLTTNGTLLKGRAAGLKEAGLDRVNVSLDTLDEEKYRYITGGGNNTHEKVLEGIDAAVSAGLTPIKLNMVVLKGINDTEIDDMVAFIRPYEGDIILQVIELMDFRSLPHLKIDMDQVEDMIADQAKSSWSRPLHNRKKYLLDGVEVEVVRPVDNSRFCQNCNRLRVTARGEFRPCLMRNDNLVGLQGMSDEEILASMKLAVERRSPFWKEDNNETCEKR